MSEAEHSVVQETLVIAIDAGIKHFLYALDEELTVDGGLEIQVAGKPIVKTEYELNAEFNSPNGWITKFGKYDKMGRPKRI